MKARYLPVIVFALASALLLAHAWRFHPFIADDALISLRYADRLLAGEGLTWTDGRPVEGYSNLLWILLVSLLGAFKVDLIVAARVLGVLSTAVALAAVLRYSLRSGGGVIPGTFALAFLALSGPMAVWAVGGLEQPLVAALLSVALAAGLRTVDDDPPGSRDVRACGFVLGLMCWTRPDAPLFAFVIFAAVAASRGFGWSRVRAAVPIALIPLGFVVAQLAFRLAYYGEWLPNPAYIKLAPGAKAFGLGARYVRDGLAAMGPLGYLGPAAVAVLIVVRETRRRGILLGLTLLVWTAYLVFIGGDIFPGWRLMVPVYVMLAFTFVETLHLASARRREKRAWAVAAGVVMLCLIPFAISQYNEKENVRAIEERWEWDGEVIGLVLARAFGDREPLLACDSAGCLPYFSGLPSLDMLGLNDHHIARQRPGDGEMREGALAHQFGDGDYVLSREPDLVSFCVPTGGMGACYRSGKEMQARDEFFARYRPILVRGRIPRTVDALLWVRFDSEKVGIQATANDYRIPAYLFRAAEGNLPSSLDAESRLVLLLEPGQAATLSLAGLSADETTADVLASDPSGVDVSVEPTRNGVRLELRAHGSETVEIAEVVVRGR